MQQLTSQVAVRIVNNTIDRDRWLKMVETCLVYLIWLVWLVCMVCMVCIEVWMVEPPRSDIGHLRTLEDTRTR